MTNPLRRLLIVLIVFAAGSPLAVGQQPQPPQVPAEFQLNAVQQAYLDQVLSSWQNESAKVTIFQCPFERWEYNEAFGPGGDLPLNKNKGELSYQKPDKGSFQIMEVRTWQANSRPLASATAQPNGDWVVQPNAIGEHWVCDGQNVYEYRHDQKQLVVRPIPPQMQGKAIVDGPLPFLFGAEADKLKARYFMRAEQPQDPNDILISARPRFQADAADYKQVDVMLDRQRMMPKAMQVYLPNGDRHVYMFDLANAEVNGHLQRIMALFRAPRTPWGWKRVVGSDAAGAAGCSVRRVGRRRSRMARRRGNSRRIAKPQAAPRILDWVLPFAREHVVVNGGDIAGHRDVGEPLGVALAGIAAHRGVVDVAVDELADRGRELADAVGVDQQARLAVAHRLGHAFDARGDHRHAGGHRFEHDHRQAFAEQARQHEQIDLGELGVDVAREAGPVDGAGDAEPVGEAEDRRFVGERFESADGPQPHVEAPGAHGRERFEQHFDAFARAEERDRAERPGAGRRRAVDRGRIRSARRWARRRRARPESRGRSCTARGSARRRSAGRPRGGCATRPGVERVEELPRGVVAGRAVDVIHERHAGAFGDESADERGARRVGVDQRVVLVLDEADEFLDDPQIEPAAHRHFHERGGRRFAGDRKAERLHASEADVVAELRQLRGEQILDALGARVVLAIDEVQRANRLDRPVGAAGGPSANESATAAAAAADGISSCGVSMPKRPPRRAAREVIRTGIVTASAPVAKNLSTEQSLRARNGRARCDGSARAEREGSTQRR